MTSRRQAPHAELAGVFHEPNRLAIVSHLAGAGRGVPFTDLRDAVFLTDGNLSRHLRTLAEAGAVRIDKSFVGARPRTTVVLTDVGRRQFLAYLKALEKVLKKASAAMEASVGRSRANPGRAAVEPA
ncbi:MAG: transcriptional regulator [Planctomycetes bacterium]|jgi:DNA-binding transcriptional ArsR family regulator|nr:transcriptional regulator [Planctomycetota bacterium]